MADDAPEDLASEGDVAGLALAGQFEKLRLWFAERAPAPSARWLPGPATAADPASLDRLLTAACAPDCLALLALYLNEVDLVDGTWGVSCLPRYSGSGDRRAFTVSIGNSEAMYATIDGKGQLTEWAALVGRVARPRAEQMALMISDSDHGTFLHSEDVRTFVVALSDDKIGASLRTVVAQDDFARRTRRAAWHNVRLLEFALEPLLTRPDADGGADREVDARYGESWQRFRKHQRIFKRLLLEHYPHSCAVCGFDNRGLLEAAHLIPDAEGGPSTVANGRLMCPNHHRAFDAGLFQFDGGDAIWRDPSVAFGRPRYG